MPRSPSERRRHGGTRSSRRSGNVGGVALQAAISGTPPAAHRHVAERSARPRNRWRKVRMVRCCTATVAVRTSHNWSNVTSGTSTAHRASASARRRGTRRAADRDEKPAWCRGRPSRQRCRNRARSCRRSLAVQLASVIPLLPGAGAGPSFCGGEPPSPTGRFGTFRLLRRRCAAISDGTPTDTRRDPLRRDPCIRGWVCSGRPEAAGRPDTPLEDVARPWGGRSAV